MMRFWMLGLLVVAGCEKSMQDIRAMPLGAEYVVQADWKELYGCLTEQIANERPVVPLMREREHRATVAWVVPTYGAANYVGEVTLRPEGIGKTHLEVRGVRTLRGTLMMDVAVREAMPQCVPGWQPPAG